MAKKSFDARFLAWPPRPKTDAAIHFDAGCTGLALRVPPRGTPRFQVIARDPNNKEKRVTIASWHPHGGLDRVGDKLDLKGLRTLATEVRANIAAGRDPFGDEATVEPPWRAFTLRDGLELHIASKKAKGGIAASTEKNYRDHARLHMDCWLDEPISDLCRATVRSRHLAIARDCGPGAANATMRVLQAVWNRSARQFPELGPSPTVNVDLFELGRRDYGLREENVAEVWSSLNGLDEVRRDYYRLLMLTGLRRTSAAVLKVEDFDAGRSQLFIAKPKGGEKRAFILPVCSQLTSILSERAKGAEGGEWLFPAATKSGYIAEPRARGVPPPHAFRQLYMSVAANLIPPMPLKQLVNHTLSRHDVTEGYVKLSPDQLAPHAQKVGDRLCELAPFAPSATEMAA